MCKDDCNIFLLIKDRESVMGVTAELPVGRPERCPDKQCSFVFLCCLFVRVLFVFIVELAREWCKLLCPFDIAYFSACGEFGCA